MSPTAVPAAGGETASGPARARKGLDPRWLSSSLLTLILVVGQWKSQILGDDYTPWLVALGTCLVVEALLHWLHTGQFVNLLSAYISGNSVAILVKPQGSLLWPFVVAALLAILSKYVLRYRERHLWNPTNFSICALLVLAPHSVSILSHQWGNDPYIVGIIWIVGLLVVIRARVWHLTIGYLVLFVFFAWVRTLLNGQSMAAELAPVTGPMYQLFMFFMVTDPRTIVAGKKAQLGVLFLIALAECVIRLAADFEWLDAENPLLLAPPMFALFFVGAPFLWWQLHSRRNTPAAK